mmetsp:Transcript_3489/g.7979  ORF Transcript_3489/g.7979 Transcript_3489/m.7979 type:complete len:418 (+) Transcript_3489:230-1483(+)
MYLQSRIALAALLVLSAGVLVAAATISTPTNNESRHSSGSTRRLQEGEEENSSFLDSVSDFFFDEHCDRTEKDISNLSDLSDWMSTLDPATNLGDITLPGTHHSAAYVLSTKFNPNDAEYQAIQDASFGVDLPDKLIAPWVCRFALTQSLSIAEQLQAGVRYFDLRVDYDPETSTFRAFHLLFGLRIEDILVQMKEFISDHPTEIIVVEMTELLSPSATAGVKQNLAQTILDTFGSALLPASDSLPTVGDMQSAGTTVIVTVKDDDVNSFSELIWSSNGIRNTFANSVDLQTMIDYNQERLGEFGTASDRFLFNKLSWILTPDSDYIKKSILGGSLFDLAKEANPALKDFAARTAGTQLGDILIVDYVETSPLFDVLELSSKSDGVFVAESGACVDKATSLFAILTLSVVGAFFQLS